MIHMGLNGSDLKKMDYPSPFSRIFWCHKEEKNE